MDPLWIGRYLLWREIAAGGMASVYLGRMSGPAGFGKTVAIKRIHPQFAKDSEFISMFLDEGRLTSALTHPNIVMTLDVLEEPGELFLVMEYVHGASLATVLRAAKNAGKTVPPSIAAALIAGALHGLHAAHEAKSDDGEPLAIVHRDVSPQNILVSVDGVAKIGDFGIAKAVGQVHSTSEGVTKGKQSYMAPEQALAEPVTARADVFAAGVVLWEALAGRRLVTGSSGPERLRALLELKAAPPSRFAPSIPPALDQIVLRALARRPEDRFPSAREMATTIERALPLMPASAIGEWLRGTIGDTLAQREDQLAELQRSSRLSIPESPQSGPRLDLVRATPSKSIVLPVPPSAGPPGALAEPVPPATETGAAISTDRNLVNPHIWKEPRTIVLGAILGTGLIALLLVLSLGAGRHPTATKAASSAGVPSATASAPEPPGTSAVTPEAMPAAAASESPSSAPASPSAAESTKAPPGSTPAAPGGSTAARPVPNGSSRAPRPAHSAACRYVAQREPSGRTTFREVCGP